MCFKVQWTRLILGQFPKSLQVLWRGAGTSPGTGPPTILWPMLDLNQPSSYCHPPFCQVNLVTGNWCKISISIKSHINVTWKASHQWRNHRPKTAMWKPQLATSHGDKDLFWRNILWSETKIGRKKACRPENTIPGGSIIYKGYLDEIGAGALHWKKGVMRKDNYEEILKYI